MCRSLGLFVEPESGVICVVINEHDHGELALMSSNPSVARPLNTGGLPKPALKIENLPYIPGDYGNEVAETVVESLRRLLKQRR